jgi:hypothetical protein
VVSAPAVVTENEVVARFPEEARAKLEVGAPLRVRAHAAGFSPLSLRVGALAPVPGEGVLLAYAAIPPGTRLEAHGLVPGAPASAELHAGRRTLLAAILDGMGR